MIVNSNGVKKLNQLFLSSFLFLILKLTATLPYILNFQEFIIIYEEMTVWGNFDEFSMKKVLRIRIGYSIDEAKSSYICS